jgi:hypothetical protein
MAKISILNLIIPENLEFNQISDLEAETVTGGSADLSGAPAISTLYQNLPSQSFITEVNGK